MISNWNINNNNKIICTNATEVAGLLGVGVAFALNFPFSVIISNLAGGVITSIAVLKWQHAVSLILISVVLTLISFILFLKKQKISKK